MKCATSFLCLICISLFFHTEAIAQTIKSKPKIAYRSVSKTSKKAQPSKSAKIAFDKLVLELGTIKEDAVLEKSFEFTNIGDCDLVIINAKGSCGCTIPTPPLLPIAPGDKGKILVKYTAKNKVGPQKPTITVTTNGEPSVVKLKIEVWVDQIPGGVK